MLFFFLPFSLPSTSSLLKLPIVVIQKFCYHGNVTSHFSSLLCNDKRESWDREENTQSSPWDKYVNFSNLKLEINQKMATTIFYISLLWGSRECTWWRFKQTIKICGPIPGIVLPFNYNDSKNKFISEIHMSRPAPYYSSLSSYSPLALRMPWGSVLYTVWGEEPTIGSVTDLAD